MSNLMLASAVKAELAVNALRSTLVARRERGADALEYDGMVVLAALIVVGIVGALNVDSLKQAVEKAVTDITSSKG